MSDETATMSAPARLLPQRREVAVLGGTTAYWVYEPEAGASGPDAPTLVAVHGFRGEHHGLAPVIDLLPGYRVVSPDLPGFGETPPVPGRTHDLELYVQWLGEFVAAVCPGAVVVGHSFGSIVSSAAVAAGLDTPRLVLINPIGAPALEGPRGIMTRLAIFYYWAGAKLPDSIGEALLRNRVIVRVMSVTMAKTRDPELRRFVHEQHDLYFSQFADRDVLRDAFVTSVSHDVSEFAPRVGVPTLLIAAQLDDITPIEKERELVRLFPDAGLVEIPDVGHLIHYETPVPAAAAISDFVGG
jgi:pimeloyl-ACP methyl ester carboxylesterase